jgi:hypothetical protein
MFASGNKKSKKPRKASDHADSAPKSEPIDILVDSIIGLLEQSSAYLRSVGNQAFSLLSSAIQESTIDLILTVRFTGSCTTVISKFFIFSATGTAQSHRPYSKQRRKYGG